MMALRTRFPLLLLLLLSGVLLPLVSATSAASAANPAAGVAEPLAEEAADVSLRARPNVLLLFAEDMSSRVNAFGDSVAVTPNLDRLAREGVRFTNVFAASSTCGPSRASLLTGVHAIATGSQHMRTSSRPAGAYRSVPPPEVKAFPERLRAAGYYTFTEGKLDYQFSGVQNGSGPFTIWDDDGSGAGWSGRAPAQPFFGLINLFVTHESGAFPSLGNRPHNIFGFVMQLIHYFSDYAVGEGPVTAEGVEVPPYYPDTPTVRSDLARLYNNVFQMDAQVGAILGELEAEGLLEETIVIWTTDHGDGLPRAKRALHDAGLRVPMIIRWPEALRPAHLAPDEVEQRLVSLIDLGPAIDAIAGLKTPDWVQGRDFLRAGAGAGDLMDDARAEVFATQGRVDDLYDRQRTVRNHRFAYIQSDYPELPIAYASDFRDNLPMMRELLALHEAGQLEGHPAALFSPVGAERLYDVVADPFELTNLAGEPEYGDVQRGLRASLEAWVLRTGDTSDMLEDAMVKGFLKDGAVPETAPPKIALANGQIEIDATDEGASIGYRLGGGRWFGADSWKIYAGPFSVEGPTEITAKAVRYGWDESDSAKLTVSAGDLPLQAPQPLQRLGSDNAP